jgi:L-ascorbate metabolism protein UlaG (beta-lactamase superfamily)
LPQEKNLAAILITHEHQDHCDISQLKEIVAKNPNALVITQRAVEAILAREGLKCFVLESGETFDMRGVSIESVGTEHAVIYGTSSPCQNTGYFINNELFVPGDALHDIPRQPVRALALPTGGPWMRLSEAIDYAKKMKPAIVFPVHDAMYNDTYKRELIPRIVGGHLTTTNIAFMDLPAGTTLHL